MYRAIIDGKEVFGWYFPANNGKSYIIRDDAAIGHPEWEPGFIEDLGYYVREIPDPSTIAVSTGRKDKHGVEIFGSQGEFQGGDIIYCPESKRKLRVIWARDYASWYTENVYDATDQKLLHTWNTKTFEIIRGQSNGKATLQGARL